VFSYFVSFFVQRSMRYPTNSGERKVGALAVMNEKYRGWLYAVLAAHLASGLVSHFGSSLSIGVEQRFPLFAKQLARLSSWAETFVHAPTALMLTPFVYGDKGVTQVRFVRCLRFICVD
jgi:hypothetical protein